MGMFNMNSGNDVRRMQEYAKQLRDSNGFGNDDQMVSGYYVANPYKSLTGALAKVAGGYLGGKADDRQTQMQQQLMAAMPKGTEQYQPPDVQPQWNETNPTFNQMGPLQEGERAQSMLPQVQAMQTRARDPRQVAQEMQDWGMRATEVPGMEKFGDAAMAKAFNQPYEDIAFQQKAAEAKALKQEQYAQQTMLANEKYAQSRQTEQDRADLKRELNAANLAFRGDQGDQNRALQLTVAGMKGGTNGQPKAPMGFRWTADGNLEPIPGGPGDKGGKLTALQQKDYDETMLGEKAADSALGLVARAPDAFGLKGALPQSVLTRTNPKGVEARAAVSRFDAVIRHAMAGTAVSESEKKMLENYLSAPTDTADVIKAKISGYKQYLFDKRSVAQAGPASVQRPGTALAPANNMPPAVGTPPVRPAGAPPQVAPGTTYKGQVVKQVRVNPQTGVTQFRLADGSVVDVK